jgi:hypothetical protein
MLQPINIYFYNLTAYGQTLPTQKEAATPAMNT